MNENTNINALPDNSAGLGGDFVNKLGDVTSVITVPPSANEAFQRRWQMGEICSPWHHHGLPSKAKASPLGPW